MISNFCQEHGEVLATIKKIMPCGHEEYPDIEIKYCPICGKTLGDKSQIKGMNCQCINQLHTQGCSISSENEFCTWCKKGCMKRL